METSARDALMAEILGDVSKLQDAVETLQNTLPAQTEASAARLIEIMTSLENAGESWRSRIDQYAESRADAAMQAVDREGAQMIDALENALNERVSKIEASLKKLIHAEIAKPVQRSLEQHSGSTRKTILVCIFASLISSTLTLGAAFIYQKMADSRYVDLGRATASQWQALDENSRTAIQRALRR